MHQIEIEPTYKSPGVIFDPQIGSFQIQGSSILVNVEEFYSPLLNWMDEFVANPTTNKVKFVFDVEYVNVASTKRFLFFMTKLMKLTEKGIEVEINWLYDENDKYILEVGEDLSQMLNLPINFISYHRRIKN